MLEKGKPTSTRSCPHVHAMPWSWEFPSVRSQSSCLPQCLGTCYSLPLERFSPDLYRAPSHRLLLKSALSERFSLTDHSQSNSSPSTHPPAHPVSHSVVLGSLPFSCSGLIYIAVCLASFLTWLGSSLNGWFSLIYNQPKENIISSPLIS